MSKTVFILGAGASYEYRFPLISKFLEKSRELYNRVETVEYKDNYKALELICILFLHNFIRFFYVRRD